MTVKNFKNVSFWGKKYRDKKDRSIASYPKPDSTTRALIIWVRKREGYLSKRERERGRDRV